MTERDINIGKEIGNYRIQQKLASGAFGAVYLAQHLYLQQRAAVIKMLHAVHLGSDEEKKQFLQEAQILDTLKGLPYILPLLDFGIDDDVPYMIADYAEQGSLRMRMRQHSGRLSSLETLTIVSQVGQGLQGAHDKGIVHRDLKPENILFNAKSEVLLADFGISTVLSTASVKYTQVAGTPAYMAPEQFRGEVCKESDQYALACISYELLTGRKPFEAPDFLAMGFLHVSEVPTPPRQLNSQIPEAVERAILKALSKQRTDRYLNVSAFTSALDHQTPYAYPSSQAYTGNTSSIAMSPSSTLNELTKSVTPAAQRPIMLPPEPTHDEPRIPVLVGYSLRFTGGPSISQLTAIVVATVLYTAFSWICATFLTGTVPVVSTIFFAIGFGIPFAIWFGGWAFVIAYIGNAIGAGILAGLPLPVALWFGTVDLIQLGLAMLLYRLLARRFGVDPIGKDIFTGRGFIFFVVCAVLPGNIIGGAYGNAILIWTNLAPATFFGVEWLFWSLPNIVLTIIIGPVLLKTLGPVFERSGITVHNAFN